MDPKLPTTIRLSDEDHKILGELQELTGIDGASGVIRLAIREALASRKRRSKR